MNEKSPFPTPAHEAADALLLEMRELEVQIYDLNAVATQEVERLKAAWRKKAEPLLARRKVADKELLRLEKRERTVFFERPGDIVRLPHGTLIFNVQEHVKKAKGVLENLERLGLEEGLKREVTVDWEALESWPDEKLIMAGTERVKKEVYSYELKK